MAIFNSYVKLPEGNVDIQTPEIRRSPRFQTRRTWVVARSCAVWQTVRTNTGRIPCILQVSKKHHNQYLSDNTMYTNNVYFIFIRFYQYNIKTNLKNIIQYDSHVARLLFNCQRGPPQLPWWRIQVFDASQYDDCYKSVQAVHSLKIGDESSRSCVNKSTSFVADINWLRIQRYTRQLGSSYRLNNWDQFFFPSPSRFRITRRHSVVCQSFPQVSTVANTAAARNTFTVLRWSRTFLSNFTPSSRLDQLFSSLFSPHLSCPKLPVMEFLNGLPWVSAGKVYLF